MVAKSFDVCNITLKTLLQKLPNSALKALKVQLANVQPVPTHALATVSASPLNLSPKLIATMFTNYGTEPLPWAVTVTLGMEDQTVH
jgi:hypothetical protein